MCTDELHTRWPEMYINSQFWFHVDFNDSLVSVEKFRWACQSMQVFSWRYANWLVCLFQDMGLILYLKTDTKSRKLLKIASFSLCTAIRRRPSQWPAEGAVYLHTDTTSTHAQWQTPKKTIRGKCPGVHATVMNPSTVTHSTTLSLCSQCSCAAGVGHGGLCEGLWENSLHWESERLPPLRPRGEDCMSAERWRWGAERSGTRERWD